MEGKERGKEKFVERVRGRKRIVKGGEAKRRL